MRRSPALLVLALGLGAAAVGVATPAQALSGTFSGTPVTVTINSNVDTGSYKEQSMGSDAQQLYSDSSSTQGIDVTGPVPDANGSFGVQDSYVTIVPPQGTKLTTGHYTDLNSEYEYPWKVYGLTVSYTIGMDSAAGDVQVLDLATNATGKLTRFDAVFRTNSQNTGLWAFGEVSMGEPTGVVHLSTRHIVWPTIAPHSSVYAIEVLHNTATTAKKIGAFKIGGQSAADYSVVADACSGKTLAAGASCSAKIGFTPTKGGPRPATLTIPTGSSTQSVSLDGSALLGSSSLTTSGADWVDAAKTGVTTTHTSSALSAETVLTLPAGGRYGFQSGGETAVIASSSSAPLSIGTHSVSSNPTSGYMTMIDGFERGCDQTGTLNVKDFAVDGDGEPTRANLAFKLMCTDDPAHPMTGTLLWQSRSDVTAPAAPTGVAISGSGSSRTVKWTAPTASDRSFAIARLVEGSTTKATAASGVALGSGTITSATLPTLTKGEQYTVLVFEVDTTGNVSTPAKHAITG